jgi:Fic family protein
MDVRSRILDLKSQWDRAQPLPAEHDHRLWQKLRLEWNYHSNHIEGNTLTYGETSLLLIQGKTTGQHAIREYEEMKAHDVGIQHVRELAADERPITEADIRDLNRIILKEPFWKEARTAAGEATRKRITPGEYKNSPNNVQTATGEMFMFKSPEETPAEMQALTEWFRAGLEDETVDLAAFLAAFHHRFSIIHPFDDGNGRTMRLLVNYALLRRGYVPVVVRTETKKEYLGVLGAADAGDLNPFAEFMARHIADALDLGLRAAKGESIEEPEDWQKEMNLFVHRFGVEESPAPPKSQTLIENLLSSSLLTLLNATLEKLKPLEQVFHRIHCRLCDSHGEVFFNPDGILDFVQKRRHLPYSSTELSFVLQGFSSPVIPAFDVSTILGIDWGDYRFRLSGESLSHDINGLRYDEGLTPKQIDQVSSDVARLLFARVKETTDKYTPN